MGQDMLEATRACLLDLEREINECYGMIDHFISLNNRTEIKYWRGVLQECKIRKRGMKNKLKTGGAAV